MLCAGSRCAEPARAEPAECIKMSRWTWLTAAILAVRSCGGDGQDVDQIGGEDGDESAGGEQARGQVDQ